MDIQTRKIQFVMEFLKLKNENLISHFEHLLKSEKEIVQTLSAKELNKRIDNSLIDSENDRVTEAEILLDELKEWT